MAGAAPGDRMTDEADVIEQSSRGWIARPSRTMLVAITVVIAVASAGISVAVARPWYHRTSLPDPCRLLPSATTAKYVPGAAKGVSLTFSSATQQHGECEWSATSQSLVLYVEADATVSGARRDFGSALGSMSGSLTADSTSRTVSGLGDQARALLRSIDPSQPQVYLVVRSGATMLGVSFQAAPHCSSPQPWHATWVLPRAAPKRAAPTATGSRLTEEVSVCRSAYSLPGRMAVPTSKRS